MTEKSTKPYWEYTIKMYKPQKTQCIMCKEYFGVNDRYYDTPDGFCHLHCAVDGQAELIKVIWFNLNSDDWYQHNISRVLLQVLNAIKKSGFEIVPSSGGE